MLSGGIIDVTLHDIPPLLRGGLDAALAACEGPRHLRLRDGGNGTSFTPLPPDEAVGQVLVTLAGPSLDEARRELTRAMRRHPQALPLVLALVRDDDAAAQLIRAGARGYLAIDEPPGEFAAAVAAVADGALFVPRSQQASFASRYLHPAEEAPERRLTERELSVLRLLAEGLCSKEVAAKLFISAKTVDTHRMNLMRKLSLRNNLELVRFALRRALVEL